MPGPVTKLGQAREREEGRRRGGRKRQTAGEDEECERIKDPSEDGEEKRRGGGSMADTLEPRSAKLRRMMIIR